MEEKCYFITARGFYVVVKSPEACSKAEMDYIASWYQDYEDAVFEGGNELEDRQAIHGLCHGREHGAVLSCQRAEQER